MLVVNESKVEFGYMDASHPFKGRRTFAGKRYPGDCESATADRGNSSQISSTIELKPRFKRFWPQGRAKRRK